MRERVEQAQVVAPTDWNEVKVFMAKLNFLGSIGHRRNVLHGERSKQEDRPTMRSVCDLLIAGMSSPSLEPAVSDSKQRSHHAQFQFETKTAHLNVIFLSISI
jgi:hypothetical protein